MTTTSSASWKRCSVCKKDLVFGDEYFECSVSTCTSGPRHPVFCSIGCWDQHVPVMRHRDAWAEQKRAPSRADWQAAQAGESSRAAPASPPRRIVVEGRTAPAAASPASAIPDDILVVASKLKAYVRARSGMNTSDSVMDALSDIIRRHADRAIENARIEARRTVMDRDFKEN